MSHMQCTPCIDNFFTILCTTWMIWQGEVGGTFLLTVVTGVMSFKRRTAVPSKMEKTGGGVSGVGLSAVQGKGEMGRMGCSPVIEGPCGGRAWWQWSALTAEETGG
jgi:hypothetical protein